MKYRTNNSSNSSFDKIYTTLRVVEAVAYFFRSMTPADEDTSTVLLPDDGSVINTSTAHEDEPHFTSTDYANTVQESSSMDIEKSDDLEKQSTAEGLVTAQTILQTAEESIENLTYETTRLER